MQYHGEDQLSNISDHHFSVEGRRCDKHWGASQYADALVMSRYAAPDILVFDLCDGLWRM